MNNYLKATLPAANLSPSRQDAAWSLGKLSDPRKPDVLFRSDFQLGQAQRGAGFWGEAALYL